MTGMQCYLSSREDLHGTRDALRKMLMIIEALRPLIEQGAVLPVPQWKIVRRREQEIATAMRYDLRDEELWALISDTSEPTPRMFSVSDLGRMVGGFSAPNLPKGSERLSRIEAPSFYLNKMSIIADEMQAVYVPPSRLITAYSRFVLTGFRRSCGCGRLWNARLFTICHD